MKTRQARKIVRRTLRCFDLAPALGRPGYKLITIIRANAIMRRATRQPPEYNQHIIGCAIGSFWEPSRSLWRNRIANHQPKGKVTP